MQAPKKFEICTTRVMLTYKSHLDKTETRKFLEAICGKAGIKRCFIAHETGKEGEYDHSHVALEFKSALRTKNVRFFDMKINGENIHPRIDSIRKSRDDWDRVLKYLSKEDEECKAEIDEMLSGNSGGDLIDEILREETVLEAVKKFSKVDKNGRLINVNEIKTLFEMKDHTVEINEKQWNIEELWPWQRELEDLLTVEEMDKRSILWIYDPVGGAGKTQFTSYMEQKYPKEFVSINNSITKIADVASAIQMELEERGWKQKGIFIDLTRMIAEFRINTTLEMIKSGKLLVSKYKSKTINFNVPDIVIFSNSVPTNEQIRGFSVDRWDVRQINDLMELKAIDIVRTGEDDMGRETYKVLELVVKRKLKMKSSRTRTTKYEAKNCMKPEQIKRLQEDFDGLDGELLKRLEKE